MANVANKIKELELSLLIPQIRSSKSALDNLLPDDFVEFGTSGNKYTKSDILERLPKTHEEIIYTLSDFSVEMRSDNVAVAIYKTERTTNGSDRIISTRTSHWRKTDKGWQMFFHEAIPVTQAR